MKRSHLGIGFVILSTFVLAMASGCGEDTTAPPVVIPPMPHDPVSVGFSAVAEAASDFLANNELQLASLEVLGPKMAASLRIDIHDPRLPAGAAMQQSCLPAAAQNKVYVYDDTLGTYVTSDTSGTSAPPGGARFTLYELDPLGDPMLPLEDHIVGFFDIHCEGQLPNFDSLTIWLVNTEDDETVLNVVFEGQVDTTASPTTFDFTRSHGFIHTPWYDDTTPIAVLGQGTLGTELKERFEITGGLEPFDSRLSGFATGVGRWDQSLGSSGLPEPPIDSYDIFCTMEEPPGTQLFETRLEVAVDGIGKILNVNSGERAPLEFVDMVGSGSGILACFSDIYVDPLIEGSGTEGGCATDTIDVPIGQTGVELGIYFDGYKGLMDLLDMMTPIYGITIRVLTP